MAIGAIPSNEPSEGGPPVISVPVDAPAWMKVRRDRQVPAVEKPPTPAIEKPSTPAAIESENPLAGLELTPAVPRSKKKPKASLFPKNLNKHWLVVAIHERLALWISKQTAISMSFSLALHSIVLLTLAFVVIRNARTPDEISLWGVVGDPNEGGEEMELDTAIPNDAGESAPIMIDQIAQNVDTSDHGGLGGQLPDATRVGSGGRGNGEGESGTGSSMGVSGLRVPGHAQTKGSFTAWADPRDPLPGHDYFIVIRVQLPKNVKKYKGSDLTGIVKGTDNYEQKIHFKQGEQFPVEDGGVVIRIRVPGAARLVRDNIKIESKLLKEKQEFEIEF